MSKRITKSVYDLKHVKSVTAWALLVDGKEAGRVVANWSDNPAGSVCTVQLSIWKGPLSKSETPLIGKAGGYGYCKFSAAFDQAVRDYCKTHGIECKDLHGRGETVCEAWLSSLGYQVIRVI